MSLPGPIKTTVKVCTCRGLSQTDIQKSIRCGADSVKTCMGHYGTKPKCGDCVHDIRRLLAQSRARSQAEQAPTFYSAAM